MAKAKVVHSEDAVTVVFKGNPKNPEPSSGIIIFPGGHVEVSRSSDGTYWAHIQIQEESDATGNPAGEVVSSRVDYHHPYGNKNGIPKVPDHEHIQHIAVRVSKRNS